MEDLLPAELTIDILSRLPTKTIIHCKCVCKKWRNLVMDSSFVDIHLSRSPTGLIIHHEPTTINWNGIIDPGVLEWVEIEDEDDYRHLHMSLGLNQAPIFQNSLITLIGSVNGLICLWQQHPPPNIDNIYICNPVTREYKILPTQNYYRKSNERLGFGVSSMTGEYKVIRTKYPSAALEADVYTLGTGQWRSLGRIPYDFYGSSNGSFLNDHCHWIQSPKQLCTFDFNKETFQSFPSPPVEGNEDHYLCLAILKGCLCLTDTNGSIFTLWVMKEYGIKESWHKEVVIKQAVSPDLNRLLFEPLYLIEGLKDGSILTLCRSKLWAFYPNNKTIEDTGLIDFSSSCLIGLAYGPSFVKLQNFELERVHMF